VTAMHDTITLSGRVSSAASLAQALTLARAYVPEGKVNNLVEVRGVQQVMLEVRVAEMQRSLVRRMGVNFNYLTESRQFRDQQAGGLTELVTPATPTSVREPLSPPSWSPNVNALFRFSSGGTTWTGFIDALKGDGLVKVLAEPTLIALSGERPFHAGGEFPVPVPQGLGTVAIEYKEFGVSLTVYTHGAGRQQDQHPVAPEVSELDFSKRRAVRRVFHSRPEHPEGGDGGGAGRRPELRHRRPAARTVRDAASKFPLLGDIPILGALFRSKSFQKNETELVIIATPRLVKPLDTANQPLPTDFYIEPNDAEFISWGGWMEGARSRQADQGRAGRRVRACHAAPISSRFIANMMTGIQVTHEYKKSERRCFNRIRHRAADAAADSGRHC
jgi:pilus assembly protein CpaC